MKKQVISFVLVVALTATLTACGGNTPPKNSATPEQTVNVQGENPAVPEEGGNEMLGQIPDEYVVGDEAVDFQVVLLTGETVKLSDYRGKTVLLNFWFINCPPCRAEMPAFEMLKGEFGDALEILTVNTGDKKESIQEFMNENGYTFNVGVDRDMVIEFPSNGVPYTLIIDQDGIIQYIQLGAGDDAQAMYDEVYKPAIEEVLAQS